MDYDYLIVGAGPAGLQLGYFLERMGCSFLIIEKGSSVGTFYREYPRHRKLISINKVHTGCDDALRNMRWDWNSLITDEMDVRFGNYTKEYFPSAEYLLEYLEEFADRYVENIRFCTEIENISRDDQGFYARTTSGDIISSRCVICATGVSKIYRPPIDGIELAESYDKVSVDPEDFTNQRVLIVGKGNSAFETADNLVSHASTIHLVGPSPLKFAWKTHFVGNLRAVNNNLLDTYQLKAQNGVLDASVEKIERDGDGYKVLVTHHRANDTQVEYQYDRIISCAGFMFDSSIFDKSAQPLLDSNIKNRFPKQNSSWESVNVPDLYFIGTLMQQRDYRKTSSGFIHGFRDNIRAFTHILMSRYGDTKWPSQKVEAGDLGARIIETINRSAALTLQFGFLGDLFVYSKDGSAQHFEGVPVDYVQTGHIVRDSIYMIATLEYGEMEFDPFYDDRVSEHDPDNAEKSTALHPVLRCYRKGELLAEHHIIENLEAEWRNEILHVEPLNTFLAHVRDQILVPRTVDAINAIDKEAGAIGSDQNEDQAMAIANV